MDESNQEINESNQEEEYYYVLSSDDDDESVEPRDTSEKDTSGMETSSELSSSPPVDDAAEAGPSCPNHSTGAIPKEGKQDPASSQFSGSGSETKSEVHVPEPPPRIDAYLDDLDFNLTQQNLFLLLRASQTALQQGGNPSASGAGGASSTASAVQDGKRFNKGFLYGVITGRFNLLEPYKGKLLDILNDYSENNRGVSPEAEDSAARVWSPSGSSVGSDDVFSPSSSAETRLEADRQLAEMLSRLRFSLNVQARSREAPAEDDREAAPARSETDSPYPESHASSGEGETTAPAAPAASSLNTLDTTSPSLGKQEKRRAQTTSSDEAQKPRGSPKKKLVTKKHFPKKQQDDSTDDDRCLP